jgi:isopentenyl-diphosphate Delta-isomerase
MPAPGRSTPIDRVNKADVPIGLVERGEVFEQGAAFRVVHVFVFDRRSHLLLQQLGARRDRNPLRWGSSVAAYLHAGEDYFEAATRRLREELNLTTELTKHGSTFMIDQGSRKFITLYTTESEQPEIREPEHIQSIVFMPLEQIERQLETEPDRFTETFRHMFAFYRATSSLV